MVIDEFGTPGVNHELLVFEGGCVGEGEDHEETECEIVVSLGGLL